MVRIREVYAITTLRSQHSSGVSTKGKMNFKELIQSLTEDERNFISSLDYGDSASVHRNELDKVIENDGIVNFKEQGVWYPYEVIELGMNCLQKGHEKEFAACMVIVLINMLGGDDISNDIEIILDYSGNDIEKLPKNLKCIINDFIEKLINKY